MPANPAPAESRSVFRQFMRRSAQYASLLRPCELNSGIALSHAQFRAGTGDDLAGTVDKLGLCQGRPLILFDEAGGSRQRS